MGVIASGRPLSAPERVDPIADPRWASLVSSCETASPFHHPAWLRLLRDQYGYEMTACCARGEDGELLGGLPLAGISSRLTGSRLVALPFSDLCPPLLRRDAPVATAETVLDSLRDLRLARGLTVEVRSGLVGTEGTAAGARFLHHTVPLQPNVEMVKKRFSKSRVSRRTLAKSLRAGVEIERAESREALDDFYRLHLGTRRRQGVPTQPRGFIRRFADLFADGLGFVLLARLGEEAIAAAVFLELNGTLVYKYGASDRDHLDKRPNNLLFWEAIRYGCENGDHTLDLGRTDIGNEGLRRFKLGWGAEEREVSYTRLGGGGPRADGGIPPLLSSAIRHGPPFLGRALGAALYRHYG